MKLYIDKGADTPMGGVYALLSEDGEVIATHICSNKSYAYGDLIGDRPERQEELDKKYNNDWQVLFLGEDDMTRDELIKRNKEFLEGNK